MKRRRFVALTLLALPARVFGQANAHVSTTDPLVFSLTRGKPVHAGRVRLELPKIAESGHSVALMVRVDSPMTAAEHVRAVHLISERNPVREMASFWLGPHSGRAEISDKHGSKGAFHFHRNLMGVMDDAANPNFKYSDCARLFCESVSSVSRSTPCALAS